MPQNEKHKAKGNNRPLNARQERFCLYYLASGDAQDAYCQAGYPFKRDAIGTSKSKEVIPYKMLGNIRIKNRLRQLSRTGGLKTKEDLLKFLGFTIDAVAEGPPRVSDQVRATEIYARLEGHFEPNKVELGLSEGFTAYLRELRASELGVRKPIEGAVMIERYDNPPDAA